nr:hypothetical protein [Tanacetum cinerariifolium]
LQHKLSAHQDTISILTQQKDAQIKLYKTREDNDIEKVIDLENKVKVLDNIVYKNGQSVQTMNMLNNKYRTSFAKPEYLKKAKQANPRLYDIGCYNDNLTLMLSPESDEVIRLEKESRSKLSDLVRPFDYAKLNSLYDLFVPQREQSSERRFFSELSRDKEFIIGRRSQVRDLDSGEKFKTSTLGEIVSLEKSNKECHRSLNNNILPVEANGPGFLWVRVVNGLWESWVEWILRFEEPGLQGLVLSAAKPDPLCKRNHPGRFYRRHFYHLG